jgi:Glycosyl hydrolase family 76
MIMIMILPSVALPLFALLLGSAHAASGQPPQAVLSVDDENQESSASVASEPKQTLQDMLHALDVMQDSYFEHWLGTWPDAIDWTAAVVGTQVSSALSALTMTSPEWVSLSDASVLEQTLAYENLVNRYFDQVSTFYFGENAFAIRMQAFDDMLWVVLGWLESIKFQNLHSELHYETANATVGGLWHGKQLGVPAAHRARIFYELASTGWDSELCEGGMVWSPYLLPYKNAITNELFISASIGMYLYFTGDPIDAPFLSEQPHAHDPSYLAAAVRAYQWLRDSNMTGPGGLYADGFHIRGYNGIGDPGTKKCDVLNPMVYTYNQGVVLSGLRGLWLATAYQTYLEDGHELIERVMHATGWPKTNRRRWAGLGRGGVLEEVCDFNGTCSQNSHTFKGIFFHHLTEFCHSLRPEEIRLLALFTEPGESMEEKQDVFNKWHLQKCRRYRAWIAHNAQAALATRDEGGKFGMWWGPAYPSRDVEAALADQDLSSISPTLPPGAVDYMNNGEEGEQSAHLKGLLRSTSPSNSETGDTMPTKLGSPLLSDTTTTTTAASGRHQKIRPPVKDVNDRGRGRTVETQSGGLAVLRAWYQWQTSPFLQ